MERPLVIYHGSSCLDGFGSAYAAWRYFAERGVTADYVAAEHGEPPPPHAGREVYLLDYAYKRPVLEQLCRQARRVVILDHHQSAEQDLDGLPEQHPNLELVFDMQRSGAVITWEYFHAAPLPPLLAHIQDRDLWRWQLPDSEHVNAALMSHPLDFELWRGFAETAEGLEVLITEGRAINRYRAQEIARYKAKAVVGEIAGHRVPVVNAPASIRSELLSELTRGQPFAAGYSDTGTKRGWSLRSDEHGLNVAEIAARFGGGGHPRAAGFKTELAEDLLTLTPPD